MRVLRLSLGSQVQLQVAEADSRLRVYTIGHSNQGAADLVHLLQQHHIEVLLDVRSVPYSQYAPQFNRERLAHVLKKAGLGYAFAGDCLGGHPTDPTCYKNGKLPEEGADFLKLVDYRAVAEREWYHDGIARLLEIARQRPTAMMCSEEDPRQCHRHHLIAQTLLDLGVEVLHVRKDGRAEPAARIERADQLTMF